EIGALRRGGSTGTAGFLRIAGDIANGRVELRDRDGEPVGGTGVHATVISPTSRPDNGAQTRTSSPAGARPAGARRCAPTSPIGGADAGAAAAERNAARRLQAFAVEAE